MTCSRFTRSLVGATLLTAAAGFVTKPAYAQVGPIELANQANASLRKGDIESAIQQYDEAIAVGGSDPRIIYNKAVALYRKGEIDAARSLFAQVSSDSKLAAQARYNLGNSEYAQAVKLSEQDSQTAINKLESAIKHYRSALASQPADADARANIELAGRLISQLKRKEQQQQQNQDQQPDQQQQDSQEQQNQNTEKSNEGQESQKEDGEQQDSSQQNDQPQNEGQNEDPESGSNQTQENSDEQSEQEKSQQQSAKQEDQGQEAGEQNTSSDEQDSDRLKQQKPQDADGQQQDNEPSNDEADQPTLQSKGEKPPEGDLKPIQNQSEDVHGDDKQQQFKEGQKMTRQEAQKMLQAVRDREFRRRLQKMRQLQSRKVPVERDW